MKFIFDLINTSQIGGWARAVAAAGMAALAAKSGFFEGLMAIEGFAEAAPVVVAAIVVGVWSSLAKKYSA